jgi:hypothetical protein
MKRIPLSNGAACSLRAGSGVREGEAGAVLVVVMLVLMTLMGLGMTALWLTNGNLQMSANVNLRSNALYLAEAGIERARSILNDPVVPDLPTVLAGSSPGNDRVPNFVDPLTGQPNGIGAVMVDQGGLPLLNVAYPPASFGRNGGTVDAPTALTMGTYTVWIRNDLSDLRRGNFGTDTNNTVIVRAQGTAADGRTTVVLEVALGPTPDAIPSAAANTTVPPELCNSGKNACDENNSTLSGIVVN